MLKRRQARQVVFPVSLRTDRRGQDDLSSHQGTDCPPEDRRLKVNILERRLAY